MNTQREADNAVRADVQRFGCPLCLDKRARMRATGFDEQGKRLWRLDCPNKGAHQP